MNACLRAFAQRPGAQLFVCCEQTHQSAPFREDDFSWIPNMYSYHHDGLHSKGLIERLQAFSPDVILVVSWHIPAYRSVLHEFSSRALRVLCIDNQWRGTAKQKLGAAGAKWYIQPLYDAVFVPGEPQAEFARKIGFKDRQIWRGLYCCDQDSFDTVHRRRELVDLPRNFVFVGRLVHEKGIHVLSGAYELYRTSASKPWPLTVCGVGPAASIFSKGDGIQLRGFVQASELPEVLAESGCLVLPSLQERWGVVIHEAVSAGLPVIASACCGAAAHFVQDGHNGYIVEPGHTEGLAQAMQMMSSLPSVRIREMGRRSYRLSDQLTPQRWAQYIEERAGRAMDPNS
jgi:glycosyltransferase involved in cell wall biosynthesis